MGYSEKLGSLARLLDPANAGMVFKLDATGEPVIYDVVGAINAAIAIEVAARSTEIASSINAEALMRANADALKAPLNGVGTSGTWPISITGSAGTAAVPAQGAIGSLIIINDPVPSPYIGLTSSNTGYAGTWRCSGIVQNTTNVCGYIPGTTLWQRIA